MWSLSLSDIAEKAKLAAVNAALQLEEQMNESVALDNCYVVDSGGLKVSGHGSGADWGRNLDDGEGKKKGVGPVFLGDGTSTTKEDPTLLSLDGTAKRTTTEKEVQPPVRSSYHPVHYENEEDLYQLAPPPNEKSPDSSSRDDEIDSRDERSYDTNNTNDPFPLVTSQAISGNKARGGVLKGKEISRREVFHSNCQLLEKSFSDDISKLFFEH